MKTIPERLRIDVHGHYFPTSYLDMLDGFGGPETGTEAPASCRRTAATRNSHRASQ